MSIEVLKQALEAMTSTLNVLVNANEQGVITDTLWFSQHEALFDAIGYEIDVLSQAIAETEKQEPVAWRVSYPNDPELGFWFAEGIGGEGCLNEPLYTSPPQRQQEPDDLTIAYMSGVYDGKNKYSPQRKPLTDEQIDFLNFLYGAGEWDGVWFESKHPTKRGAFWWRKDMKRLFDYDITASVAEDSAKGKA